MTYLQCGCFSWFGTQDSRQCGQDTSAEQTLQQMEVGLQGSYSVDQCDRGLSQCTPLLSGAW